MSMSLASMSLERSDDRCAQLDGNVQITRGSVKSSIMERTLLFGGRSAGRIQPVSATHLLNISAGVWKPSVLRGLSFNCRAIALS